MHSLYVALKLKVSNFNINFIKYYELLLSQCTSKWKNLKRPLPEEGESDGSHGDYEDSDDDDEDAGWAMKTASYARHLLYHVTDSPRFQPPRKKPR